MTNKELDEMIDWCRKKLDLEKHSYDGCIGKRMEGYEKALCHIYIVKKKV